MRRKDREIKDISEIVSIMKKCDVCRLALNNDGYPYIIPLNFGISFSGEKIELVFHSARQGQKVCLMQADNRASFEMDCSHQLQYFEDKGYCTFSYESVIGRGHISILEGDDKVTALRLLMDHYHPGENAYFNPASIPATLVYKLTVDEITGKRRVLHEG